MPIIKGKPVAFPDPVLKDDDVSVRAGFAKTWLFVVLFLVGIIIMTVLVASQQVLTEVEVPEEGTSLPYATFESVVMPRWENRQPATCTCAQSSVDFTAATTQDYPAGTSISEGGTNACARVNKLFTECLMNSNCSPVTGPAQVLLQDIVISQLHYFCSEMSNTEDAQRSLLRSTSLPGSQLLRPDQFERIVRDTHFRVGQAVDARAKSLSSGAHREAALKLRPSVDWLTVLDATTPGGQTCTCQDAANINQCVGTVTLGGIDIDVSCNMPDWVLKFPMEALNREAFTYFGFPVGEDLPDVTVAAGETLEQTLQRTQTLTSASWYDQSYEDYYNGCQVESCSWTEFESPEFIETISIVIGLVGGMSLVVKFCVIGGVEAAFLKHRKAATKGSSEKESNTEEKPAAV